MLKIKEYLLKDGVALVQTIYMPASAQVFNAIEEGGTVTLFALIKNTEPTSELRHFEIHGTGELFSAECVKHIATYKSSLGTRHVFEVLKEGGASYEGYLH